MMEVSPGLVLEVGSPRLCHERVQTSVVELVMVDDDGRAADDGSSDWAVGRSVGRSD